MTENQNHLRRPAQTLSMLAVVILLFAVPVTGGAQQRIEGDGAPGPLEKLWETGKVLSTPESVLFDAERSRIYVSNVSGEPTAKDGNGFISILSPDGQVVSRTWVSGLDAPKGMAIVENRLYVSDITRLVEIDIGSGKISRTYPAEGALFLNDVTADSSGTVYVSDYGEGHSAIYRLQDNRLSVWIQNEELSRPNGLLAEDDRLLAGTADGKLLAVAYDTRSISVLADLSPTISGIDGIVSAGDGMYLVSDWAGTVLRLDPETLGSEEPEVLSSTADQAVRAADIGFADEQSMLLVPTFSDNRVMAYRLSR